MLSRFENLKNVRYSEQGIFRPFDVMPVIAPQLPNGMVDLRASRHCAMYVGCVSFARKNNSLPY